MDNRKQMWSSWAVLLLVALLSIGYVTHGDESVKHSKPALRSRRMVGGTLAPIVPWQAMVFLSDNILEGGYAGGALISDRWVLTAGRNLFVRKNREHTQGVSPRTPKVYLGISSRVQANESTEVAVEKVILHPNFQAETSWDNDLALIKLKHSVVMSDKITPIPLPESGQDLRDVVVGAIAGWGWGIYLEQVSSLKHHILPLTRACGSLPREDLRIVEDLMICTGPNIWGNNVCDRDAGGALAVMDKRTGDVYAAGILSYDKACRQREQAVYMNLQSYLPWIHKVLRGDTEMSVAYRNASMSKMIEWAQ
ncbi:haptoglobin isoform X2 [Nelusetta ayraudi]|uniref:haptoglobin isoform X2 n=1 Tax=Nelusetta ayraudi TaxID=303726 RepID=UPI003F70798E